LEKMNIDKLLNTAEKTAVDRLQRMQSSTNLAKTIPYDIVQRETTNVLLAILIWKTAEYNGD